MKKCDLNNLVKKFFSDNVICGTALLVLLVAGLIGAYASLILGLTIVLLFCSGCGAAIALLNHKKSVAQLLQYGKEILGFKEFVHDKPQECDVCGTNRCKRHIAKISRDPWKGLFIDKELDNAIDRFYTNILTSFVESWFSVLSKDEDFVHGLKEILREATCRLILKLKEINVPALTTNKLLPCTFAHYEMVQNMLRDGIPMGELVQTAILNERPIHPAVVNRQSELDYLRTIAKCLVPRLCSNENFSSKVFFSLVRELLACWVLLPLMDVISDPNLINLLVLIATNKTTKPIKLHKPGERVMFLENFARKRDQLVQYCNDDKVLTDQNQLYSFMQFLKKEGAVDILRFYLDVDNLNRELLDPKVTTDPAKLSSLYQQSEKLLKTYQTMMKAEYKKPAESLTEAAEDVKQMLQGKWQKSFHLTPEYFRLIYGNREIEEMSETKYPESQSVFRLGSKLKGAIRGAIDGTTIEATEVSTVWDAFTDEQQISTSNSNIYNSVTQKLRKERGQNLENFIVGFMQSIEPTMDVGEDVITMNDDDEKKSMKPLPPGRNLVFGNLFELKRSSKYVHTTVQCHGIKGPSQCLVYILVRILKTPMIIVRFVLALINISQSTVDSVICKLIDKLVRIGLYEPRLTYLLTSLENVIFRSEKSEPSSTELHERQRQARMRLESLCKGLGSVSDVLQSPPLNKHLMYCLFDIIVAEIYPELDNMAKE